MDYIRKSFYLAECAKEMRLTNISRVMQKNFADSVKELIRTVKTDGVKVAFGLYTVNNLGQTLSNYGAEIYAVYRNFGE